MGGCDFFFFSKGIESLFFNRSLTVVGLIAVWSAFSLGASKDTENR
jgi:hypothetical protein